MKKVVAVLLVMFLGFNFVVTAEALQTNETGISGGIVETLSKEIKQNSSLISNYAIAICLSPILGMWPVMGAVTGHLSDERSEVVVMRARYGLAIGVVVGCILKFILGALD